MWIPSTPMAMVLNVCLSGHLSEFLFPQQQTVLVTCYFFQNYFLKVIQKIYILYVGSGRIAYLYVQDSTLYIQDSKYPTLYVLPCIFH